MDQEKLFDLAVITPDRIFYEGKAFLAELSTREGEIGIYKNHIPLTAILEPGILVITEDGKKREAALHGGFLEILPEKVTILAEGAEWPGEIDVNRAREAKIRAERRIQTRGADINIARAEIALRKALVRIELAGHGKERG